MVVEAYGWTMAGLVGKIFIREKSGQRPKLDDLLVAEDEEGYLMASVRSSLRNQITQLARESITGMKLEEISALSL